MLSPPEMISFFSGSGGTPGPDLPSPFGRKIFLSDTLPATHIKDAQIKKKGNLNVLIVKVHMLPITKGVRPAKNRCSDNMWWTTKKAMHQF